jgi:hypothetical protein
MVRIYKRKMILTALLAYTGQVVHVHATKSSTRSTSMNIDQNWKQHQGATDKITAQLALRDYTVYGTPLEYHAHSTTLHEVQLPKDIRFDTDSYRIRIDNCCSRSLTHDISDFVPGTLRGAHHSVEGLAGSKTAITHIGTISWAVLDDLGVRRTILLPNSVLVPAAKTRLLSPQHMAQEYDKSSIVPYGTVCTTFRNKVVLEWDNKKYKKTIYLSDSTANVANMYSAPGYKAHQSYCKNTADDFSHPKNGIFSTKVQQLIAYTAATQLDPNKGDSVINESEGALSDSEGATAPVLHTNLQ